jgi:hypothetical protein
VPLELADVKSPAGEIDTAVWFPGEATVDTSLSGYIADAESESDDEDAQEQWVYYRAATAVADRLAGGTGASVTLAFVDQGSKTTTATPAQADYWAAKAAAYLAAFEALDTDIDDDPLGGFSVLTSMRHG